MILQLRGVHAVFRVEGGVLVQVGHEDCLAVGGLDVLARATVTVAAGSDSRYGNSGQLCCFGEVNGDLLIVKRAVDLVLLGSCAQDCQ